MGKISLCTTFLFSHIFRFLFIFQSAKIYSFRGNYSSCKVVYGIMYNIPVFLNVPKPSFTCWLFQGSYNGPTDWLGIIVNGIRLPLVTASLISLLESSKKGPLSPFSFSSLPAAEAQFCF